MVTPTQGNEKSCFICILTNVLSAVSDMGKWDFAFLSTYVEVTSDLSLLFVYIKLNYSYWNELSICVLVYLQQQVT